MEHGPFEDDFTVENGSIAMLAQNGRQQRSTNSTQRVKNTWFPQNSPSFQQIQAWHPSRKIQRPDWNLDHSMNMRNWLKHAITTSTSEEILRPWPWLDETAYFLAFLMGQRLALTDHMCSPVLPLEMPFSHFSLVALAIHVNEKDACKATQTSSNGTKGILQ